jgi:twitching motility protein PilT
MNQIDILLTEMLDRGGSDLHLSVGTPPKARIHGIIHSLNEEPVSEEAMELILKEVTPPHRWETFLKTGDVDLAHEIPGKARFRMNMFRNNWGMAAVLRQVPSHIPSIDELNLPATLKKLTTYKDGLVLVTGPTGSGKSTTLAAVINHINENYKKQVITLEDPVEFAHTDKKSTIIHREVGEHTKTYYAGLKGAMRADPDVILIGEMRDKETIGLALNCAAMGMLVFATLHTNSAAKTIDRIINAFPADEQNQTRIMLGESLRGIVSQLLCKKKGGGRVAVHEILLNHLALPHCIRTNPKNIENIIGQNRESGMITMDASLNELLKQDLITMEEAYMKAADKSQFKV